MARLLGLDVGTSSVKGLLIDETGQILAQASAPLEVDQPQPGWSEQKPEDWWTATLAVLELLGEKQPDAIGLSGQMHGSAFLDAAHDVIRPALLWNDQRTKDELVEIERLVGAERVRNLTLNPPLTGFQLPKILWLRNHELSRYQQLRQVLLPKDYVRFRLTGDFLTEVSDASGTGIFEVRNRDWAIDMMADLELDPTWFPPCKESDVASAETCSGGFLDSGIPIVGGGGDQAAAAVGTGAVVPGVASLSLGTSGVAFAALAEAPAEPSAVAHLFCHANRGWHAMGVMLACGNSVQWASRLLFGASGYDAFNEAASQSPPGARGLTFGPYLTGERSPHVDPDVRGGWMGLDIGHGAADLARAVLEGVSFGLAQNLDLLQSMGAPIDRVRATGGGTRSAIWLEILATMLGMPIEVPETDEGPAYGAALLAGVGIGVWEDVAAACRETVKIARIIEPGKDDLADAKSRFVRVYPALSGWSGQIT